VDDGCPLRRAAERFQVSVTTAKRWADRYRRFGEAGVADRDFDAGAAAHVGRDDLHDYARCLGSLDQPCQLSVHDRRTTDGPAQNVFVQDSPEPWRAERLREWTG
jgi:hypothetical protein